MLTKIVQYIVLRFTFVIIQLHIFDLQYGLEAQHQVAHEAIRKCKRRTLVRALATVALLHQHSGHSLPASEPEGLIQHSQKAFS